MLSMPQKSGRTDILYVDATIPGPVPVLPTALVLVDGLWFVVGIELHLEELQLRLESGGRNGDIP